MPMNASKVWMEKYCDVAFVGMLEFGNNLDKLEKGIDNWKQTADIFTNESYKHYLAAVVRL